MSDDEQEKSIPLEATEACREIGPFVSSAEVSDKIGADDLAVRYFNVCTRENKQFCIEVSEQGFRVVATQFDTVDGPVRATSRLYETSHALLQTLSEAYKHLFAEALSQRLTELAEDEHSSDSSEDVKDPLPAPLSARFVHSFAYRTIKDRIPVTLTRTIDSLCRRKQQFVDAVRNEQLKTLIGCLSQFKQELQTNKPLTLFAAAFDRAACPRQSALIDAWNAAFADYTKRHGAHSLRYFEAPWLLVECYAYHRIEVHRANIGLEVDVFEPEKRDAFEKLRNSIELLVVTYMHAHTELKENTVDATVRERLSLFLRASLWANHADLSLFDVQSVSSILSSSIDKDHSHAEEAFKAWSSCFQQREHKVLADDSSKLIDTLLQLLSNTKQVQVAFVLDNSGFELVADLCLASLLVSLGASRKRPLSVTLYVKTEPWFVSDATCADLHWTLERLETSQRPPVRAFATLLREQLRHGTVRVEERTFWHLPHAYCDMQRVQPELYAELAASDLLLFKGDLNYRKLVGDRDWPVETSVKRALHGFEPTCLCVLRTLKADVCVGLDVAHKNTLDTTDPEWMVNGEYGVIQFLQPA